MYIECLGHVNNHNYHHNPMREDYYMALHNLHTIKIGGLVLIDMLINLCKVEQLTSVSKACALTLYY